MSNQVGNCMYNIVTQLHNHCCSANATVHSECSVELRVNVSNI